MIRVEIEEVIECPIDGVFERLIDIPGYSDWMSKQGVFIDCRLKDDEEVGEGSVYLDHTRFGTVRGEVTRLNRPSEIEFHYSARFFGKTAMEGWPEYRLERLGDHSTRVHHVATGQLHGLFKLLHPVMQRLARNERRRTVSALKRSLEANL